MRENRLQIPCINSIGYLKRADTIMELLPIFLVLKVNIYKSTIEKNYFNIFGHFIYHR